MLDSAFSGLALVSVAINFFAFPKVNMVSNIIVIVTLVYFNQYAVPDVYKCSAGSLQYSTVDGDFTTSCYYICLCYHNHTICVSVMAILLARS